MTSENSPHWHWAGQIGLVAGAAVLGFMLNQIWNLQSTVSMTAIKLGELAAHSNETLINTRQLIQQGTQIAAITNEQLRALEARVDAGQQNYAQGAEAPGEVGVGGAQAIMPSMWFYSQHNSREQSHNAVCVRAWQ